MTKTHTHTHKVCVCVCVFIFLTHFLKPNKMVYLIIALNVKCYETDI